MSKFIFGLLIVLSYGMTSFAWVESSPMEKNFSFKFKFQGEAYEYSQRAPSYEEAFEKAAKACFHHYKAGRRVSEDRGLDIIDVCANPRSI